MADTIDRVALRAEQIPAMMEYDLMTGAGSSGMASDFDLSGLGTFAGQISDMFGKQKEG